MRNHNRERTLEALEAQRWQAEQASRERSEIDSVSFLAMIKTLIADGRNDEAQRRVQIWRATKHQGDR
jgi:hypothetical protein